MKCAPTPLPFPAKFPSRESPPTQASFREREREYLRPDEVSAMIKAARKVGRHGHRDAANYKFGQFNDGPRRAAK